MRVWWRARGVTPVSVSATSTSASRALRRSVAAVLGPKRRGEGADGPGRVIGVPAAAFCGSVKKAEDREREDRAARTLEMRAARRAGYVEARPPPPSSSAVHRLGAVRSPGLEPRMGEPCRAFVFGLSCECVCVSAPAACRCLGACGCVSGREGPSNENENENEHRQHDEPSYALDAGRAGAGDRRVHSGVVRQREEGGGSQAGGQGGEDAGTARRKARRIR